MRYSQAEKMEIIELVERSELSAKQTLEELGIARSSFYDWYDRYQTGGYEALAARKSKARQFWNRIPDEVREEVRLTALEYPDKSPRQLAWFITDTQQYYISESSTYRILKDFGLVTSPVFEIVHAKDEYEHKTTRVNELWQTDFTQFKVVGWGWYYLCTVLDDFSRYILAWRLAKTMETSDVEHTLDIAREFTGVDHVKGKLRPRLLSDNGSSFTSKALALYLKQHQIKHIHSAPYHPQTQGKIERWHRSMKNIVKLDTYFFPWDLRQAIGNFVDYYNDHRYHESLDNMIPADVYSGRAAQIHLKRQEIRFRTLQERREYNLHFQSFSL
jgi:putative transposase